MKGSLTFWYEFASTYSWLATERIEAIAEAADIALHWRPFLLGPIFAAQGWNSSPFNLYAAKGRNMWRDVERLRILMGLPALTRPDPFPQNSLLAARVATALPPASRPKFSRAVYRAQFTAGASIADRATLLPPSSRTSGARRTKRWRRPKPWRRKTHCGKRPRRP